MPCWFDANRMGLKAPLPGFVDSDGVKCSETEQVFQSKHAPAILGIKDRFEFEPWSSAHDEKTDEFSTKAQVGHRFWNPAHDHKLKRGDQSFPRPPEGYQYRSMTYDHGSKKDNNQFSPEARIGHQPLGTTHDHGSKKADGSRDHCDSPHRDHGKYNNLSDESDDDDVVCENEVCYRKGSNSKPDYKHFIYNPDNETTKLDSVQVNRLSWRPAYHDNILKKTKTQIAEFYIRRDLKIKTSSWSSAYHDDTPPSVVVNGNKPRRSSWSSAYQHNTPPSVVINGNNSCDSPCRDHGKYNNPSDESDDDDYGHNSDDDDFVCEDGVCYRKGSKPKLDNKHLLRQDYNQDTDTKGNNNDPQLHKRNDYNSPPFKSSPRDDHTRYEQSNDIPHPPHIKTRPVNGNELRPSSWRSAYHDDTPPSVVVNGNKLRPSWSSSYHDDTPPSDDRTRYEQSNDIPHPPHIKTRPGSRKGMAFQKDQSARDLPRFGVPHHPQYGSPRKEYQGRMETIDSGEARRRRYDSTLPHGGVYVQQRYGRIIDSKTAAEKYNGVIV